MRIERQQGFTLIELMIAMVIFLLAIAAASNMFTGLLNQFKQQSKIAETNIKGIAGLELLRFDIEQAGYGLPWNVDADGDGSADSDWSGIVDYCEAKSIAALSPNPALFNDGNTICPGGVSGGNAPRAILSDDNAGFHGSDYLVVKSTTIALNSAAQKWTYIKNNGLNNNFMIPFTSKEEDLNNDDDGVDDSVIVLMPLKGTARRILLIDNSVTSTFFGTFNANANAFKTNYPDFVPPDYSFLAYLIYGVDTNTNLRMPFNRADYYISTASVPLRCADAASGTGILVKSLVSHDDGDFDLPPDDNIPDLLPLLDCVADMQVIYRLDTDGDGTADSPVSDIVTALSLTAEEIREQVKEVRVYILAHEGQYDSTYIFNNFTGTDTCPTCVRVGEKIGAVLYGQDYDLSAINDYLNYRWRVYTLVIKPYNLK
jgi:prepilin-type N-terminal cleavage/methylation domain-containing protein